MYYGANGRIEALLDRNKVMAGQAPEAFKLGLYYRANKELLPDRILQINGSTEPAIISGMDVCCIPGDENNYKITTQKDLEQFKRMVERVDE